jgi:hypothetical protein
MKINRLEAHDRLEFFIDDQTNLIFEGANECLNRNPLSLALQEKSHYIYIFAHPRTADDGVTKRLLWQPRLAKPQAQTNSYLFRATSHTDILEICWLIPPSELWSQYEDGKVCQSEWVVWSIDQFKNNRRALEAPFADDLSNEQIRRIYLPLLHEKQNAPKPVILGASSFELS